MNLNYSFDQTETDSQNYYFYKDGFSVTELKKIELGVAKSDGSDADVMAEAEQDDVASIGNGA